MNVSKFYTSPELEQVTADTETGFATSGGFTADTDKYVVLDPLGQD